MMSPTPHARAAAFALAFALSACGGAGDGSSAPHVPTVPAAPTVASVTIAPSSLSLTVGGTGSLTAAAFSAAGSAIAGKSATWSSSNAGIAMVANGSVTAVAAGTATITADIDGKTATASVTVAAAVPSLLEIVSGDAQRGLTGRALADSVVVRAKTTSGMPAAGATLAWTTSSGALSAATTTTDVNGLARVQWTAGLGDATATVALTGSAPLTIRANGRASGSCTLAPQGQRMTLGATDFTLSLRATAPHKVVVLFVDFSDAPSTANETFASIMSSIVTPGLQMLNELSYGRVQITTTPINKWYRMSQPLGSYTWRTYQGHKDYISEAMRLADADVDFSPYDAVYIFTPDSPAQTISPTFNGGQTGGVVFDGRMFGNGVTFAHDSRTWGPSILAHETGHMFGLVDLYSFDPAAGSPYTGNQFRDIGAWSLMSNVFTAGHTLAWEKRKLGFIDDAQVDCIEGAGGEEVIVQPVEVPGGIKLVALPLDASRALAIEVRSNQGIDANLCATGVLIYEVNAAAVSGYDPAKIRGSRTTTSGAQYTKCGPWADGTYGVGSGQISTFTDAASGVSVQVLAAEAGGAYRLRVKR